MQGRAVREGWWSQRGHIAYAWRLENTDFVVSVHGYRDEPRAQAMMGACVVRALVELRASAVAFLKVDADGLGKGAVVGVAVEAVGDLHDHPGGGAPR